jgi:hypothetical protein
VLALIAGFHVQSVPVAHASTSPRPSESSSAVCHIASDEVTESEWDDTLEPPATFYPEDTIIAPRPVRGMTQMQTPAGGVTQMQAPVSGATQLQTPAGGATQLQTPAGGVTQMQPQ